MRAEVSLGPGLIGTIRSTLFVEHSLELGSVLPPASIAADTTAPDGSSPSCVWFMRVPLPCVKCNGRTFE